jgi:hypothetical protein
VREPDDPGAEYPGKLSVQLATRGVQCELITTGYAPRLRLEIPWLGGWDSAAFEDNVLAAQSQDGQWRFWWPWIRPIGFADDAANVAEYLAGTMMGNPLADENSEAGTPGDSQRYRDPVSRRFPDHQRGRAR